MIGSELKRAIISFFVAFILFLAMSWAIATSQEFVMWAKVSLGLAVFSSFQSACIKSVNPELWLLLPLFFSGTLFWVLMAY